MRSAGLLTTTDAAALAAVTPSTIKRWADQGLLPVVRTAGGHRRFERTAVERLLHPPPDATPGEDPRAAEWVRCLVDGRRHEIDGQLLEARSRLGSWCLVADELGVALAALGRAWARGRLTIADEHVASDALARSLARIGDALPTATAGPRCVLACADGDEHTLGLALADVCLRELHLLPVWLGRRTPAAEVVRMVKSGAASAVALSASTSSSDARSLARLAAVVGRACDDAGARLFLGGAGAWPAHPRHGVRLTSFASLRDHLASAPG